MSESIKRTLFASSGSDGKFTASVSDIEVFPNRDDPEHCLVRFKRTLTIDSNGYEETSDELVELTFTHQDGRLHRRPDEESQVVRRCLNADRKTKDVDP